MKWSYIKINFILKLKILEIKAYEFEINLRYQKLIIIKYWIKIFIIK